MPLPETPREDARDLILKAGDAEPARPPVRRPVPPSDILLQIARSRPTPIPEEAMPQTEPEGARGVSLDDILLEILADPEAAFRSVAVLYQDFLVRCRRRRVVGEALDLPAFRRKLTTARAGVGTGAADGPEWVAAVAASTELPEDIQGIFLLLARAAIERAPCPSDHAIARACGSRSSGRARRLLAYMEQRGAIAARGDLDGRRVIALTGLGLETAPGDPSAADEPSEPDGGDLFAVA